VITVVERSNRWSVRMSMIEVRTGCPSWTLIEGIDMSGRRPLIKDFFAALRLIVGAVKSSAC
jgi:hypothetical protein